MEGCRIGIDCKISDIELSNIRRLIIPGGDVSIKRNEEVIKSFASLFVIGNKSNRGGGFGTNGSIIFGDNENPLK